MDGGVIIKPTVGATGPVRMAPVRAELEAPPLAPITNVDGMLGRCEYERARFQHMRQRAGVILRIRLDFGKSDVTGRADEFAKLMVGDRRAVDEKSIHPHVVGGRFLGI